MESSENSRHSDNKLDHDIMISRSHMSHARVLIVDDNHANLDAVKSMIKPYGIKTDCVDSGRKAVAAVSAGNFHYNAILMDYMMPDMDGIETTRAIRNIGTDYALEVPIIALTADENADNEEMFLRNGFQAFLTKPIDIPRLDEVIVNWVQRSKSEDTPEERQHGGSALSTGAVKLKGRQISGLDIGKGIERFGGDEEAYLDVLRSFTLNTRNLLKSIENVGEETSSEYMIVVHGIKGSSRSVFADAVADAAAKLENAYKEGDFEYVSARNHEFIDNTRSLICNLEDMLAAISADDRKPMRDKPDAGVLSGLLAACEAFEMERVYEAMKELEKYEYKSDNELVIWLCENADLMNYSEIADRLSGYLIDEN